jgi:hypothetical protein
MSDGLMAANILHWLNRTVDRLFGFDLTAEELRWLDDRTPAPGNTWSQHRAAPASPPHVPRPAAH